MKSGLPSAERAIHILAELLEHLGPGKMPYWVTPNTVLTFSGARAFCDGVFWGKQRQTTHWLREIKDGIKALEKIAHPYIATPDHAKEFRGRSYAGYEVILEEGLRYVLAHTSLVELAPKDIPSSKRQKTIMDVLTEKLKEQPHFTALTNEDLNHIAFGILVGYPDKAITESVTAWDEDRPTVDARIAEADHYACPQPVYMYPKPLAKDKGIQAHEKAWSKILTDFYASDFHTALAAEMAFQEKVQALEIAR